jgi:hypothetical protein
VSLCWRLRYKLCISPFLPFSHLGEIEAGELLGRGAVFCTCCITEKKNFYRRKQRKKTHDNAEEHFHPSFFTSRGFHLLFMSVAFSRQGSSLTVAYLPTFLCPPHTHTNHHSPLPRACTPQLRSVRCALRYLSPSIFFSIQLRSTYTEKNQPTKDHESTVGCAAAPCLPFASPPSLSIFPIPVLHDLASAVCNSIRQRKIGYYVWHFSAT